MSSALLVGWQRACRGAAGIGCIIGVSTFEVAVRHHEGADRLVSSGCGRLIPCALRDL